MLAADRLDGPHLGSYHAHRADTRGALSESHERAVRGVEVYASDPGNRIVWPFTIVMTSCNATLEPTKEIEVHLSALLCFPNTVLDYILPECTCVSLWHFHLVVELPYNLCVQQLRVVHCCMQRQLVTGLLEAGTASPLGDPRNGEMLPCAKLAAGLTAGSCAVFIRWYLRRPCYDFYFL